MKSQNVFSVLTIIQRPKWLWEMCLTSYPAIIKAYGCDNPEYFYEAEDYGKAITLLYDAFEHSKNGWVAIETF